MGQGRITFPTYRGQSSVGRYYERHNQLYTGGSDPLHRRHARNNRVDDGQRIPAGQGHRCGSRVAEQGLQLHRRPLLQHCTRRRRLSLHVAGLAEVFDLDPCWEVHSDGACRKDGRSSIGFAIHAVLRSKSVHEGRNSAKHVPSVPSVPLVPAQSDLDCDQSVCVPLVSENKRRKIGGARGSGGVEQKHTAISACTRDYDYDYDEYGYCERILIHCSGYVIQGNSSSLTCETLAMSKALEYLRMITIYHRAYIEEKQTLSHILGTACE